MDKKWYLSKTLWVNVVAVLGFVAQGLTGQQLASPEMQATALGIVNLVLRLVTKSNVTW